jgi:hypothetical protein
MREFKKEDALPDKRFKRRDSAMARQIRENQ